MNLESIRLGEISQSQKDKYCMIHFYEVPRGVKLIEAESRRVVPRGWGRVGEGWGVSV